MLHGKIMLKNCKSKLVVGVIGLGVGAFHLRNCISYKNCEVKYICDKNQKKLLYFKKKFNIQKVTKNFDDVVNDDEVNVVIIASYDNYHFLQVKKALIKNKHVFIEKPMTLSLDELRKITSIKKKKPNLFISTNLVLRTHPFFEKLIKEKKKLKKIYYLEGDYNYGRLDKLTTGWRGKIDDYSVILGGGVHLLDLILKIKEKKIKEIYSIGNKLISSKFKNTPDDFAISILKFEDESIAKISSNFSSPTDHHHVLNIYSKNTAFFYNRDKSEQYFREKDNKPKITVRYKYNNKNKGKMLINFLNVVSGKKGNLIISEREQFYLMKICLILVESLKKKKIIKI